MTGGFYLTRLWVSWYHRGMKKINVYLREDQYEALRDKAFTKRTSITDYVRRAVDMIIKKESASQSA